MNLGFADPLPLSDEAGHLSKVHWLLHRPADPAAPLAGLHTLLISGDAYPRLPHLLGAIGLQSGGGLASVRSSNLLLHALHLGIALRVGPGLFGRAGAVFYALLVSLSPIWLAWQRYFFVDLALTEAVGCAVLLVWAGAGLRSRRAGAAVAVAVAMGLLTKWVFVLLLCVPVAAAGWAAAARWGAARAAGVAAGALGIVAFAAAAVVGLGRSPWIGIFSASAPLAAVPMLAMGLGVLVALGAVVAPDAQARGVWALMRRMLLMLFIILMIAGPFYTLAQAELWGRLALEQRVHGAAATQLPLSWPLTITLALVPFGGPLLLLALALVAARDRRRLWPAASAALGGLLSFAVLVWALPFDPRYLLPLLPLFALALSCAAPAMGRLAWPLTAVMAAVLATRSLVPLWPAPQVAANGLLGAAVEVEQVAGQPLARLAATTRLHGVPAEVERMVLGITEACASPCVAHFSGPIQGAVQGRGLEALLQLAGVDAVVREGGPPAPGALQLGSACRPEGAPPAPSGCVRLAAPRADCSVWSCGIAPGAAPASAVHGGDGGFGPPGPPAVGD